jgi:hypothetical protein
LGLKPLKLKLGCSSVENPETNLGKSTNCTRWPTLPQIGFEPLFGTKQNKTSDSNSNTNTHMNYFFEKPETQLGELKALINHLRVAEASKYYHSKSLSLSLTLGIGQ